MPGIFPVKPIKIFDSRKIAATLDDIFKRAPSFKQHLFDRVESQRGLLLNVRTHHIPGFRIQRGLAAHIEPSIAQNPRPVSSSADRFVRVSYYNSAHSALVTS